MTGYEALCPISADSHIIEPPNCYRDHIDPAYRDRAPYLIDDPVKGATFIIEGLSPVHIGTLAAAGVPAEELGKHAVRNFDRLHRGGWDPTARLADMERDGVVAEILYPSVGMALCLVDDLGYMNACFRAYNRWLSGFCAEKPDRLFGIGQSAAASPDALVQDMEEIGKLGLKGVMLPLQPGTADYDDPSYDEAWAASVELDLPVQFHVLTRTKKGTIATDGVRGSKLNNMMSLIRANQDLAGLFVFGGVFERHPGLKVVSVEADAGWIPHFAHRMDHFYDRVAIFVNSTELSRPPSEYLFNNMYFTFQDDRPALRSLEMLNHKRLLWANDYPHTDSTWPHSMALLERQMDGLDLAIVKDLIHANVAELYGLKTAA